MTTSIAIITIASFIKVFFLGYGPEDSFTTGAILALLMLQLVRNRKAVARVFNDR